MTSSTTDPIYNPTIFAGALWTLTIRFKDNNDEIQDLTGYTFYMDIVNKAGGRRYVSPTIVNGQTDGTISISLTPTQSEKLATGVAYYDLLMCKDSEPENIIVRLRGYPTIIPVSTRRPA